MVTGRIFAAWAMKERMDEIQLMGSGLATSAQLDAFRKGFGASGPVRTLWMSATAQPDWLQTVDHSMPDPQNMMTLSEDDRSGHLAQRLTANKTLQQCSIPLEGHKKELVRNAAQLARHIMSHHAPGTMTLVIINTVKKAKAVHEALKDAYAGAQVQVGLLLVHSQFRPQERRAFTERLTESIDPDGPGLIAVTTQVVEAGVDISARTLYTELCPWAGFVQRLGRLNRKGEYDQSNASTRTGRRAHNGSHLGALHGRRLSCHALGTACERGRTGVAAVALAPS